MVFTIHVYVHIYSCNISSQVLAFQNTYTKMSIMKTIKYDQNDLNKQDQCELFTTVKK